MTPFKVSVILLVAATGLRAQDPNRNRETITSAKLNSARPVIVVTPNGYNTSPTRRYPVVVLLDANDGPQFQAAVANINFLVSRDAIPPVIIAGIPNGPDRTHDLTPPPTGKTAAQFATAGGADAFTDFIVDEVMPMVRQKYRTLNTTILAGHSFGGLLALHVAATRPGFFAGTVAMSPALWWNDSSDVTIFADALAKSKTQQRLFVTSGGLEPEIDRTTQRFVKRLEATSHPAVAMAYHHYPDDTHGLTPMPSLTDGLRYVFDPVSLTHLPIAKLGPSSDSATVIQLVVQTEQQYATGARTLGLNEERLPESTLNQLGYNVLQGLKMPGVALWVFKRNVALYPESANVYDSLGDGYLGKGDSASAREAFTRAVDLASKTNDPVGAESKKKIDAIDAKKAMH